MKKLVFVTGQTVRVVEVEDEVFATSTARISREEYRKTLEAFEVMQKELQAIDNGDGDASALLRRHGPWLANLARTGFAIEYAQFVKE